MEEARIKCPTCGSEFPAGATFCPQCGEVVPLTIPPGAVAVEPAPTPQSNVVYVQPPAPRETNWGPWLALPLVVLLLIGGAWWMQSNAAPESDATANTAADAPAAEPAPAGNVTIDIQQPDAAPAQAPPAAPTTVVIPPVQAPPATPPATNPPPAQPAPPANPATPQVEIISVSADPLERSGAQWRYGYTFKVRNNSSADARVTVQVKFLDGDGYVVDDDIVSELLVPANTEQVVNDEDTLDADLARRVRSVNASFR